MSTPARDALPGIPAALQDNALLLRLLRGDIEQTLSVKDLGATSLRGSVSC
ncbi:hypothetical protein ACWGHM_14770 [Streptomyces sp. NPDC054904]|uniref:hypothetical protein n=1 Tax=Streptomyces sp. NPDC090054 TaxID=3365933 RepID=UPI003824E1A4